jgi:hypothetical protein
MEMMKAPKVEGEVKHTTTGFILCHKNGGYQGSKKGIKSL